MESSLSSLLFKGLIPEAINEAKRQKKLFVVYLSGQNDESVRMESSTWMSRTEAESLPKYCIILQLFEGTTDAAYFSAIYPQKSSPCITVVGYNGIQIWQSDGFITAEVLTSTLEKAWLSLHIQETTATVLSAALASKSTEPLTSGPGNIASTSEESSSIITALPSMKKDVKSPEDIPPSTSEITEENKADPCNVEDINIKIDSEGSSKSSTDKLVSSKDEDQSTPSLKFQQDLASPGEVNLESSRAQNFLKVENRDAVPVKGNNVISGVSPIVINKLNEVSQENETETVENKKADELETTTSKSNEVYLNIRLLDGSTMKEKFLVTNTLRMVKDCITDRQVSDVGAFDLIIPYPRKSFDDQDLSRSLLELGLLNRQALIVVPHKQGSGGSSSRDQADSTSNVDSPTGIIGGSFAYVRSFLSYVNPFSYLGGSATSSSSSEQEPPSRQYGQSSERRTYTNASSNDRKKNIRPSTSRIGSNIHTLKHDEDDDPRFNDRNSFWNGNSTQYGGGGGGGGDGDNNDSK